MSEPLKPTEGANKTTAARPSGGYRWKTYLIVIVTVGFLIYLLILGVVNARPNAWKVHFANNLKHFGLGAHNFHETYGHFPPFAMNGRVNPDVTQPISYHTTLIPYLEANDWYDHVDMTIPWDDPANREFYELNVSVFQSPRYGHIKSPEGYAGTSVVPNSRLLPEDIEVGTGLGLEDITDGAAGTILAGGIDDAAIPAWGDPENARDPAHGFAGGANAFGGLPNGGSQVLFADGHVDELSAKTSPEIAKALATPSGGEPMRD